MTADTPTLCDIAPLPSQSFRTQVVYETSRARAAVLLNVTACCERHALEFAKRRALHRNPARRLIGATATAIVEAMNRTAG